MITPPRSGDVAVEVSSTGDVSIAGLPVFVGNDDELLAVFEDLLSLDRPQLVVTPNVDQVIDLSRDSWLWAAYNEASLRTLDGMPLVWLAQVAGARSVIRQTGADMLTKCVAASAHRGWRIVILGGAPEENQLAVINLRNEYPQAQLDGLELPFSEGFQGPDVRSSVLALSGLNPDFVFVCLGSPKQEKFFMELRDLLPAAVYVGAGAAVDFASGSKVRAPRLMQKLGLEWTWRLAQEPRRLARRYLIKGLAAGSIMSNTIGKKLR